MTKLPQSLGELRHSRWSEERIAARSVRQEMRENVLALLECDKPLFPGIHGYDDTVIPQIVNGILSRHNFILLGLRGQAKSRILRSLVNFLDPQIPVIAGCEINDNPYRPICRTCRERVVAENDRTPIAWMDCDQRYVEKLATPDVTIADIIGDVDPIRAARGGRDLADELTIHYGLLPRSNRGIFAINELPDLAGKIQVGLFNIMQEGDVQIKGYPLRLPLDVLLVFTANPEDYTARGKIITPLKDRIGSEIRTHYPSTVGEAMAITAQEAWIERATEKNHRVQVPDFIRELVEEVAFLARDDKKIDKRSGVSQRLPISSLEDAVSSAEQRAARNREHLAVVAPSDIYAAIPSMTGKFELEYEGELRGAETIARDLVRTAAGKIFTKYLGDSDLQPVVQWFESGGQLKLADQGSAPERLAALKKIPGLIEHIGRLGAGPKSDSALQAASAEFILEGLWAHKRINRSEERGFYAAERRVEPREAPPRPRRQYNN